MNILWVQCDSGRFSYSLSNLVGPHIPPPWGRWCFHLPSTGDALHVHREGTDFGSRKVSKLLSGTDSYSDPFRRAAARGGFYFCESQQWWHSQLCLQVDFRLLGSRWVQTDLQANCESVGMTFTNECILVKLGNGHFVWLGYFLFKKKYSVISACWFWWGFL